MNIRLTQWLGRVANWAGYPAVVRPCTYRGLGQQITVRVSDLFTIITVNGVDVYFYRLSGRIDGVGLGCGSATGGGGD